MSGTKHATITLSEAEYRRLHDADMQGRFSHITQLEAERIQGENEALRMTFEAFEERQRAFQQYIGALENEIGQMEIDTAQALVDQQDGFQQELASRLEGTTIELDEVTRNLSAKIESSQHKHAHHLVSMKRQLDALAGDLEHKNYLAEYWLSASAVLRDFIDTNYDHAHFLPGFFTRSDLQMQQAIENLRDGMTEAALLGAQQVYGEYTQARLNLERLTSEWQILFQATMSAVEDVLSTLSSNKFIPALDEKGRVLPIQIHLGEWSEHRYTDLTRQVKSLRSRLHTEAHSFTSAELTNLLKTTIPGFKREFDTLVYEARLAVIYSQIRINIADIAIQALERQGFAVTGYGFEGNNMRQPYFISLQNIEGSQVVIRVNPIQNAEASNDLVIESHDTPARTESELRSRSQEILHSLARYGLRVGPVSTERGVQPGEGSLAPGKVRTVLHQESHHD